MKQVPYRTIIEEVVMTTHSTSTCAERLRLGSGFVAAERQGIVDRLGSLDERLRSFRPDTVDLELSVKERGTPSQRVVLEAHIAGWGAFAGTSTKSDLDPALTEVRDDLVRQLSHTKERTEARNNRHRRTTT